MNQEKINAGLAMLAHVFFQLHPEEAVQEALDNALSDMEDGSDEEEAALFAEAYEALTLGNQQVERLK